MFGTTKEAPVVNFPTFGAMISLDQALIHLRAVAGILGNLLSR